MHPIACQSTLDAPSYAVSRRKALPARATRLFPLPAGESYGGGGIPAGAYAFCCMIVSTDPMKAISVRQKKDPGRQPGVIRSSAWGRTLPLFLSLSRGRPVMVRQARHERSGRLLPKPRGPVCQPGRLQSQGPSINPLPLDGGGSGPTLSRLSTKSEVGVNSWRQARVGHADSLKQTSPNLPQRRTLQSS